MTSGIPLNFPCGRTMKNKFMLAPMTNTQSHADGRLSPDEWRWLTMRAKGQFGIVMTCATAINAVGRGFPGQLAIYDAVHEDGHRKLAKDIQGHGSLALVQLHHAGMRSPKELIGEAPVSPSAADKYGARALTLDEVEQLKIDFIRAAIRAQRCGYDGVEVHGAHGYILTQFLSAGINKREDAYGGSLENRARLMFEIIEGIREACGPEFILGVRVSPERFGMDIEEVLWVCEQLIARGHIDFLDISMWDVYKYPQDPQYQGMTLLEHFLAIDRKDVLMTVAGKIGSGRDVHHVLDTGVDFVTVGRSAILHHDFPARVMADPDFEPHALPVSKTYLDKEGVGEKFVQYLRRWPDFVQD